MLQSVYQHTVRNAFTLSGIGLHTGAVIHMTVRPAPVNSGITFVRTDVTDRDNIIPAKWDHVVDTRLCTVIGNKAGVTVSTIEHAMSVFAALGLDNATIDITGPEMPIIDGSGTAFIKALDNTGLARQDAHRRVLVVKKTVVYREGDKEVILSPADRQYYGFELDYSDSAIIGRQKYLYQLKEKTYRKEIAAARTFTFVHEIEALRKAGLIKGGSLDNAIVVDRDRILNEDGLRYKNEFVRHKILDAIGDIYLGGAHMIGHYHGIRAGHAMNNKALHALFANPAAYAFVELNQPETSAAGTHAVRRPLVNDPAWAFA